MGFKKKTREQFIKDAKKVHGDKYDYSKVEYKGCRNKVCIICPKHGEFWQKPSLHLGGMGCLKCGNENKLHPKKYTTDKWIKKAKEVHRDKYDYSKVEYVSPYDYVTIICPKHGEFLQKAYYHLSGNGCPKCGYEKVHSVLCDSKENFINKSKIIYGDLYDYSKVEYVNNKTEVILNCPKHGEFKVRPDNHLTGRNGCPHCSNNHSSWETELFEFINTLGVECINGDRSILDGKELDIFIPSIKVAFECNGLRWHSELFKNNEYHLWKTNKCKEKGIRLIHIFEDEWNLKKEIVKNRIKSIIGCNERIYARKCKIRGISDKKSKEFIEMNHLQGYVPSKFSYGLYYNGKLVSVASFGYNRVNLGSHRKPRTYELLRLCTIGGITVIGGASKLISFFIKRKKPKEIISYCDLRWSNGNVYENVGFRLDHVSKPNYFYVVDNKRKNRFVYRKDVLIREGYDPNKTEHEIMLERGIYRIYDCGCNVYKMKIGF